MEEDGENPSSWSSFPVPRPPWLLRRPRLSAALSRLESSLQCRVCMDAIRDPVTASKCGHTFCSLCVRRYLTVHRRACPECLNDLSEADLRPNRAVAAVAEAVAGENGFLRRLWEDVGGSSKEGSEREEDERRLSESSGVESDFSRLKPPPPPQAEPSVPCPVCTVEVPGRNLPRHEEQCKQREIAALRQPPASKSPSLRPMSKPVYHLVKETKLRQMLKEAGLDPKGSKPDLIRRHQRFVVLWNSECDRERPMSKLEMGMRVAREEEAERRERRARNALLDYDRKTDESVVDAKRKEYLKENKSSFDTLVEEARRRKKRKSKEENPPSNTDAGNASSPTLIPEEDLGALVEDALGAASEEEEDEVTVVEERLASPPPTVASSALKERKSPFSSSALRKSTTTASSSSDEFVSATPQKNKAKSLFSPASSSTPSVIAKKKKKRSKSNNSTKTAVSQNDSAVSNASSGMGNIRQALENSSKLAAAAARRPVLKVPCPGCQQQVPQAHINAHLDRCLEKVARAEEVNNKRKRTSAVSKNRVSPAKRSRRQRAFTPTPSSTSDEEEDGLGQGGTRTLDDLLRGDDEAEEEEGRKEEEEERKKGKKKGRKRMEMVGWRSSSQKSSTNSALDLNEVLEVVYGEDGRGGGGGGVGDSPSGCSEKENKLVNPDPIVVSSAPASAGEEEEEQVETQLPSSQRSARLRAKGKSLPNKCGVAKKSSKRLAERQK